MKDDVIDQYHSVGLHIPSRRIYLKSSEDNELDHETAAQCIKNLHILEALNSDPIEIWINTPGGSETDAYAIHDVVGHSPCHIRGVAIGECSSAGTLVLQACDVRVAYQHTYFLYHDGTISLSGNMRDVESQVTSNHASRLKYYAILGARTGKEASYWNRRLSKDLCLTAEQAKAEGLLDEVIARS